MSPILNKTFNSLWAHFSQTHSCALLEDMKSAIYYERLRERMRNLSFYSIVSAKNKCDYTLSTINNDNNNDATIYNNY